MKARGVASVLTALVAAALAAAPAGAAQPSTAGRLYAGVARLNGQLALMGQGASALGLSGRQTLFELHFKNRDGYAISVLAFGQTVALDVSRAKFRGRGTHKVRERVAETTYLAHGRVTSSSIEASFGERGRVDVRFRPSGREVHATRRAGCKKPNGAVIAHLGRFEGKLSFHGEGGFTSVDVRRARGRSVDVTALLACLLGVSPRADAALPGAGAPLGIHLPGLVGTRSSGGGEAPSVPTHPSGGSRSTTLVASRKEPLARLVFAAQARTGGRPHFLAVSEGSEGSIGIVRLAYVRGAANAFSFDDSLSRAAVHPPPPFRGDAELRRGPRNEKAWSGPLSVSFLGAPRVPLSGTPFNASLSQGF